MGGAEGKLNAGILQYIHQEFQRVVKDKTRKHLTLSQVLEVHPHEDFPFDFKHLGILFVCDRQKDGVFSIHNLEYFATWIQLNLVSVQMYEFKSQLQARTVSKIIQTVDKKDGEIMIVNWFLKALLADKPSKSINGGIYLKIETIKLIYQIFNVKVMSDLDIQTFFYLVKHSSQQMGYPIEELKEHPEDEDFQEYIEIAVCREFITYFLKGAAKILKEIGYSSSLI